MEQLLFFGLILLAVLFDLLLRSGKRARDGARPAGTAEEPLLVEEEVEEEEDALEPAALFSSPPLQAPSPAPRSPVPPPPGAYRRRRLARWLTTPADARRGMILMAVLGPCRGLEPAPGPFSPGPPPP